MNNDTDLWKLPKTDRKMIEHRVNQMAKRISHRQNDLWRAQNEVRACEYDIDRWRKELTDFKKKYNISA